MLQQKQEYMLQNTSSRKVVQKTAEATGDLIGNKIADKITSLDKPEEKTKKVEEIDIPPEKRQQIIDDIKLFWMHKNGISKIVNLLETTSDDKDLPRFVTKKSIELYDQLGRNYNVNKEIRIETPMLRSDLCDFSDAYIVVKGTIAVTDPDMQKKLKVLHLKIMHHLSITFQKLMVYKLTMQKMLML